jgi:hypothetical protein
VSKGIVAFLNRFGKAQVGTIKVIVILTEHVLEMAVIKKKKQKFVYIFYQVFEICNTETLYRLSY